MVIPLPVVIAAVALIVILLAALLRRGSGSRADLLTAPRIVILHHDLEREIAALLGAGNKIEAIKRVREETGTGLKDAKELVDRLEARP